MKKILVLTALVFGVASVSSYALAEGERGHGKHKGAKLAKMFEKSDLNGDGVISKEEFMKKAEERFAKMDLDGNGEITKEEAQQAREKMKEKWKEHKEKRKTEDGD